MKINEIVESISSSSVASVSFPLFGDAKAARRAVDPKGYTVSKKSKNTKPYHKKVKDIYDI